MKKRVGILTFHYTPNYGAVLQALALKHAISQQGYQCSIIDYRNACVCDNMRVRTLFDYRNPLNYLRYHKTRNVHQKKLDMFKSFISENLCNLNSPYTQANIDTANRHYDTFVCGSDQVWNSSITASDMTYFLDFVCTDKQRIAYSASCGTAVLAKEQSADITNLLLRFQAISVREQKLKDMLNHLKVDSVVCCDPTLLLNKADWRSLIHTSDIQTEKSKRYVFAYELGRDDDMRKYAAAVADDMGIELIYLASNANEADACAGRHKFISFCHPASFVAYMQNASYVVTNSFHGTIFSINFERQFSTFLLKNSHAVNIRITELLSRYQLSHNIISAYNVASLAPPTTHYDSITKAVRVDREAGLQFLARNIKNEGNE